VKTIQSGEYGSRLRRLLGIRGPLPLTFDEQVSPVALLGDGTGLPFALDPLSWGVGTETTGGAAELSTIGIHNSGPELSACLIEQLVLEVGTADTRVEVSRSGILQTAVAAAATKFAADLSSKCQGLATALDTPVEMLRWILDITTVGSIAHIIRVGAEPIVLPCSILLRRGEVCYVKTLTDAVRINVSASGRYWSNVSDLG
jgi:hypothetical protein